MIETFVVVLTSATARLVESSSASSVNYPYFTLAVCQIMVLSKQLDLLEVASSDFQGPKNRFWAKKRFLFTSPGYVHSTTVGDK